jgi:methylmalonyl-CoA mutase
MFYEMKKHTGELPIIGVNTYLNPNPQSDDDINAMEIARATTEEKETQINNLRAFQARNNSEEALERLKQVAKTGGNIFEELMETVKVASLGQITQALYEVGGQYRRNM